MVVMRMAVEVSNQLSSRSPTMVYVVAVAVVLFELLGAQAIRAPFPRPHHHLAKREADYFNWTAVSGRIGNQCA
jgi:hypothetical protein